MTTLNIALSLTPMDFRTRPTKQCQLHLFRKSFVEISETVCAVPTIHPILKEYQWPPPRFQTGATTHGVHTPESADRRDNNHQTYLARHDHVGGAGPGQSIARRGYVAFTLRTTNWRENRYEQRCMLGNESDGDSLPLTRTGNVQQIEWVDEQTLALLRTGPAEDEKPQIWLYEGTRRRGLGGDRTEHRRGLVQTVCRRFPLSRPATLNGTSTKRAANVSATSPTSNRRERIRALLRWHWQEMKRYRAENGHSLRMQVKHCRAGHRNKQADGPNRSRFRVVVHRGKTMPSTSPAGPMMTSSTSVRQRPIASRWMQRPPSQRILNVSEPSRRMRTRKAAKKIPKTSPIWAISRTLHLPAGAGMAAVAPDGEQLLIVSRERDQKMYTREDYCGSLRRGRTCSP